jgi:hypothetical protein
VVFNMSLGLGIDGGEPSSLPLASGAALDESLYERTRLYTFGDAVVGTRGLLIPSLTTYLASQYRFSSASAVATARPSIYDGSPTGGAVLVRHAFGELRDTFSHRLLKPLFIRAGRQFRYGQAVAHFDGITVAYDGPKWSVAGFSGTRVSLYGLDGAVTIGTSVIAGLDAEVDLARFAAALPVLLSTEVLELEGATHTSGGATLRFGRDVIVQARARAFDGELAHEHLSLRARPWQTGLLHLAIDNRHSADWSYDLIVADGAYRDGDDPRRFLTLGVPPPRIRLSARGGRVFFENLDVMATGAVARHYGDTGAPARFPSYAEAGLAADVRLRRSVRFGSAVLTRRYARPALGSLPRADDGIPQALPELEPFGARTFHQGDLSFEYARGVRQFRARSDFYLRLYRQPSPLRTDVQLDSRAGGRFSLSAWAGKRLHVRFEYEATFAPEALAPEIRGTKTLRLLGEGWF